MNRRKIILSISLLVFIFLIFLFLFSVIFFSRFLSQGKPFFVQHYPNIHEIAFFIARNSFAIVLFLFIFSVLGITYFIYLSERSHFYKNAILFWVTTFIFFSTAEITLRFFRWKPGRVKPYVYFQEVDSLFEYEGYYCDSEGLMKVSPLAAERIKNKIKQGIPFTYEEIKKNKWIDEVYILAENYLNLPDNSYASLIRRIRDHGINSPLDSAIMAYHNAPVNSHGFRSIEFNSFPTKAKRILLLGDSFTWGHSTTNKTNSFADELLAKGYAVYNSGITATDPAQYLAIARRYIPALKPDVVVVNFYMGNDLFRFKRTPSPRKRLFTFTNAGALMLCPQGVYFDNYKAAYDYALKLLYIPKENNGFNRWCSYSASGTFFWSICKRLNLADFRHASLDSIYRAEDACRLDKYYMGDIAEIRELCNKYDSKFIFSIFPDIGSFGNWVTPEDFPTVFDGFDYKMAEFSKSDYDLKSNHLNDQGNKKYAVFLDSLIRSLPDE
jgi:hypothetical protein